MTTLPPDHAARQAALNPADSFIVQAPAGSGKTELLTQRYLALLGQACQTPENIIALTFTNKAAAEMRQRIIASLSTHTPLAQAVLERDQEYHWNILENPQRLRIQTIDAFCRYITRQLPILSAFGSTPDVCDDPHPYYVMAAQRLLANLEQAIDPEFMQALQNLLLHLNNDHTKAENLLANLLYQRDQWLPLIMACKRNLNILRTYLEQALQTIAKENMQTLANIFSAEFPIRDLPGTTLSDREAWLEIADALLTKTGEWRKRISKQSSMKKVLEALQSHETAREALVDLRNSPPLHYPHQQWEIIVSLLQLLPLLSANLLNIFREHRCSDFTEISQRALLALSDHENPSSIALQLDYQIQHILVDEFQDTSVVQFKLLEQLTREWIPGDGRTLFLVGDPMQSIYRFRAAEVGLFIHARHQGINHIFLKPLTLTANFRSQANLIQWTNKTFQSVFPKQADITIGAVNFSESEAMQTAVFNFPAVTGYGCHDKQTEAEATLNCIQQLQSDHPNDTIAVLIRSRTHLKNLLPQLQQAQIPYQAIDIIELSERSVVKDLWALTRALLHFADRIAWLAFLRAPWCGLILADLYALANPDPHAVLWDCIKNFEQLPALSLDAQQRLAHIVPILKHAFAQRSHYPLRSWIENTWITLGGPSCLQNVADLQDADHFFTLLAQMEVGGDILDFQEFERRLNKLYASSQTNTQNPLHIMTIHKAKGLEFDHVIMLGLDRITKPKQTNLFTWTERLNQNGEMDILFIPMSAPGLDKDPIYRYIENMHAKKDMHEMERLLYVAMTRAKKSLHLFAQIEMQENGSIKYPSKSFLAKLWPTLQENFQIVKPVSTAVTTIENKKMLRRLSLSSLAHLTIEDL